MRKPIRELSQDKYFSNEEEERLLRAPNYRTFIGVRDFALLKLFLNSGLRKAELVNLKVGDLKTSDKKPYLIVHSKGGSIDEQEITDKNTIIAINNYFEKAGHGNDSKSPMFQPIPHLTKTEHKKICFKSLEYMIKKYAKFAGIKKNANIHMLRHTYGTRVYARTKDLALTQLAMRHRSIQSTMIYMHCDRERLRKGLELATV